MKDKREARKELREAVGYYHEAPKLLVRNLDKQRFKRKIIDDSDSDEIKDINNTPDHQNSQSKKSKDFKKKNLKVLAGNFLPNLLGLLHHGHHARDRHYPAKGNFIQSAPPRP